MDENRPAGYDATCTLRAIWPTDRAPPSPTPRPDRPATTADDLTTMSWGLPTPVALPPLSMSAVATVACTCISPEPFPRELFPQSPRTTHLFKFPCRLGPRRRHYHGLSPRQAVMSATQPSFLCPEASDGLRLALTTTRGPSPLRLIAPVPGSQVPAVFIQSCLGFRKNRLDCGGVAARGADDFREPLPEYRDH